MMISRIMIAVVLTLLFKIATVHMLDTGTHAQEVSISSGITSSARDQGLPLIIFIAMEVVINKDTVKKVILYCSPKPADTVDDNVEAPVGEIGVIVDDNMRRNAIICEIRHSEADDIAHYRESFMEIMDEIVD
ncbi:uncharacterized protein [Dysidea avara]|uniref:uncharacterized protein n=1 Tax=Dysidea avara TaxID=196820 RepID=UPI00332594F4